VRNRTSHQTLVPRPNCFATYKVLLQYNNKSQFECYAANRNRIQTYDSTFGFDSTDALTLHRLTMPSEHQSLPGVSVFDDRDSLWYSDNPRGSVIHPDTGTQIRVKGISAKGGFMQVVVRPAIEQRKRSR
jgi:hypothetical protein